MPEFSVKPTQDTEIGNHSWSRWYILQDGKSTGAYIGCWDWADEAYRGKYGYQGRGLYKFGDLGFDKITPDSVISSVKLKFWVGFIDNPMGDWNKDYYNHDSTPTIDIHRITNEWDEGTGDGHTEHRMHTGAGWKRRTTNRYWNSHGGDYDSTPVASLTTEYKSQWVEFDITDLYKKWKDGTYPNHGIMIKLRDDHLRNGAFWTDNREANWYDGPEVTVDYNDPPEAPRGLEPDHYSVLTPSWADVLRFDWDYIDYRKLPETTPGRANIMYLIDSSGSFSGEIDDFSEQMKKWHDRLEEAGVECSYTYIRHKSSYLVKYDWWHDRKEFEEQIDRINPRGGDYWDTHKVFLDSNKGAKSIGGTWSDAEVYVVFTTDEGNKGSTSAEKQLVVDWANENGYKVYCIVRSNYKDQFDDYSDGTGGKTFDIYEEWSKEMPVPVKLEEGGTIWEGDYQSKAELRFWKIEDDGTRTYLNTVTHTSSWTVDYIQAADIPLINGGRYEWDVITYDSSGLKSPPSKKAKFVYRDDLSTYREHITWGAAPLKGDLISKTHWTDIRDKLREMAPFFQSVNVAQIDQLFNGDIVPVKEDYDILYETLATMLKDSNMDLAILNDVYTYYHSLGHGFIHYKAVEKIRSIIDRIRNEGPRKPQDMTAVKSDGMLYPPEVLTATHSDLYSNEVTLSWTASDYTPAGIEISAMPSESQDVLYYRLYHNYTFKTDDGEGKTYNKRMYTDYRLLPAEFDDGDGLQAKIFLESDGPSTDHEIKIRAVDGAGNYSDGTYVDIDGDKSINKGEPFLYLLSYQLKDYEATQPDFDGTWEPFGLVGRSTLTTTHKIEAYGTLFYKICAMDTNGDLSDFTFTTSGVKIQSN